MHARFRSYQIATQFYREASRLKCPSHLKSHLQRASSSIVLNLSEGSARPSEADRKKFYFIAFSSLRECQAILDPAPASPASLVQLADLLGANLYRLTHPRA